VFKQLCLEWDTHMGLPRHSISHRGQVSDEQLESSDAEYWTSTPGLIALLLFWSFYRQGASRDHVKMIGRAFLERTLSADAAQRILAVQPEQHYMIFCNEDSENGLCTHMRFVKEIFAQSRIDLSPRVFARIRYPVVFW